MQHYSVMLKETIDLLDVKEGGLYMDGTLGRGGHTKEILDHLGKGKLYCFDLDKTAISESKERLNDERVIYIHDNFANFINYIEDDSLDGIVLDLGVSSPQFDDETRGFSYRFNARLDMRMNVDAKTSAYEVVNNYEKADLVRILRDYGEEPFANKIADRIIKKRAIAPIETTFDLVDVIKEALPNKVLSKKGHPAKQTFQAIRIEVNQELNSLETFLAEFDKKLKVGGRVVIITFHSLEDRLVKKAFQKLSVIKTDKRIALMPDEVQQPRYNLLNRKMIVATEEELLENSRSKSAKLRGIIKVKE